ncbi:IS110 family transposase [Microbacterium paludicola]|uniref:IS110 family transposase n=1 Tax=Microbacterium paludicola TaxID=300019 RepID=A0A4Y9FVA7_9MICO|nr:IS110 family transposase [Microbacterium paludicola]MBF0816514.1 IS110 family transposase [Microbacterium paludicola]TFU32820.1 IS110 family transposase [Microbacterium paludicola]
MTIVADRYRFITGVDTHSKKHQYAVVDPTGRLLQERSFPTDPAGITRARTWLAGLSGAAEMLVAIDGAGSYGRPLAEALGGAGIRVVEAPKIRYRPSGKDDRLDARAAAAAVLPLEDTALNDRKSGAERDAIQILLTARAEMTRERTQAINRLTALARRFDLGIDARRSLTAAQIRQVAAWRPRKTEPVDTHVARTETIRLAARILALRTDITRNLTTLRHLTEQLAPQLLTQPGIGPVTAAQVFASWSHPGRVRSEAAFARLAGTAPKPASSGDHSRHRLDRGGDRHLNAALHRVIITRWRSHPETLAYAQRRRAEGRTDRDIRRILKRYLARTLYRLLEAS